MPIYRDAVESSIESYWPNRQSWKIHMTKTLSVTIPQACKITGLGRSTIYRLFEEGKLQRLKAGSRTLIKMDDLEAYIESLSAPTE